MLRTSASYKKQYMSDRLRLRLCGLYLGDQQASIGILPEQLLAEAQSGANAACDDLQGLQAQPAQVFPMHGVD